MRIVLLALIGVLSSGQQLPPLLAEGRQDVAIVDLRSGLPVTAEQLVEELAGADRVLVGERHDNPDHHALQRWLLEALAQHRQPGSLLLEMLNPDQQERVNAVRLGLEKGHMPVDLPDALDWQPGWDWSLYGELVEYALHQPGSLLAANLDRSEIIDIYRNPQPLSGLHSNAPAVLAVLEQQIRESHCGMLPDSQVVPMRVVQQQLDRRMAERLLAAPEPAVLFAGSFHVRADLGVPLHLQDLGGPGTTRVLILSEEGVEVNASQADFVWRTPARPAIDFCDEWRQRGG